MLKFREIIYMLLSFFIGFRYRKKLDSLSEIKKIIVFKPDHIGDLILSIPVFENLRYHMPHSRIIAVVNSSSKSVLESSFYADKLFGYDAKFLARSKPPIGFIQSFRLLNDLLREKVDLIVDLRITPLSLVFALLSGAKYRLDRASRRILGRVKKDLKGHEVEINLDIIQSGGIPISVRHPRFFIKDSDKHWAKGLFEELKLKDDLFLVAMHIGAPKAEKRWPIERFAHLVQELHSRYKAHFLIIGGKDEMDLAEEIIKLAPSFVSNLVGKTDFEQLAAILERCRLFVGNDSGPMHLAAAVDTKTIGLLGPITLDRFKPYGKNSIGIRGMPNCPPCQSRSCKISPRRCLDQIHVEDVLRAVNKLVDG